MLCDELNSGQDVVSVQQDVSMAQLLQFLYPSTSVSGSTQCVTQLLSLITAKKTPTAPKRAATPRKLSSTPNTAPEHSAPHPQLSPHQPQNAAQEECRCRRHGRRRCCSSHCLRACDLRSQEIEALVEPNHHRRSRLGQLHYEHAAAHEAN